jgi:hypothetical protein
MPSHRWQWAVFANSRCRKGVSYLEIATTILIAIAFATLVLKIVEVSKKR